MNRHDRVKISNLRIPVDMHVEHQLTKGGSQKVGKLVILHTPGLEGLEWSDMNNLALVLPEYKVRVEML